MSVELVLLGRVAYRDQEISGPRLGGLLALLAGDLRTGCSNARLVEGLWPEAQPANPAKAVQILVSRARAQLGAEVIARTPTGYRLTLDEDRIDASALLLHASAGAEHLRAGDHAAALARADAGLALWEGPAGADGGSDDPVAILRTDRASTRRSLVRIRALALARLGRPAEAFEPLAELTRERPRDEEVLLELLRCEAATTGPSSALARYEAYRRSLRDELGTDPGAALQAEHQQLLQGKAPVVRHGVPYEPNPLLGRADDIAAVTGLLRTSRVTSIVGPGGLGKTRLAYVVSREAEQRVVHVVPLAGVTTDSDVAAEVASALGAGDARRGHHSAPRDALLGIVEVIRAGPALLVLDNCEQVVRGVADLVHALVSMTRDLRVLTTSRTPLGLTSEAVYLLPELALPTTVELFSQRARAARPDADLPRDVVQELCRRLDGLPLAVELAAARVRVMSVAEVARRLEDRFGLLRGSARDAPERHHTLHAVVDWSWNLLGPDGQSAMRALSIFPGGFTAAAAQHLPAAGDALSVLEGLVDQSLLKVTDTASGTRFRMLETVREFSTAARESAGETDRATTDFLAWARGFGVAHHDSVFGPDPFAAVGRVRAEQDNLVQAFRLGLARDDGASVVATSAAIGALLAAEGNYARVDLIVGEADWLLSHYRPAPEFVEATRTVLTLASVITQMIRGQSVSRSLVALRRLPPASPRTLVGAIGTVLNAPSSSPADLQRLCESDEPLVAAAAAAVVSYYWEGQGDLDNALALARRMVDALENQDVPWLLALAHARATELSLQIEDGTDPRQHLLAALPVLEKFGATTDVAGIRWWMVLANIQNGALDEAEHWVEQADSGQGFDGQASDGQASDGQAIDGQAIDGQAFGDQSDTIYYDVAVRAELRVAQGEVADGLRLWRRVVDGLRSAREQSTVYRPVGFDPWALEAEAVAVVAHAQHGRLDLVESITADLPDRLTTMLSRPVDNPPPYLMEGPIWGALLLALAMVDLDRGERSGDKRVTRSGVRLVALAERFRFLRYFRPTMSSARVRKAALDADRAVYEDAVSSYAGLDRDDLRLAALAVLHDRDPSRTSARAGS